MNGPTESCVRAYQDQLASNHLLVLGERLEAMVAELELVGETDRLRLAQDTYERAFGPFERGAVKLGADRLAPEAATVYQGLVAPRQKAVRELALAAARHENTAQVIEQTNRDIEARGPQPTGECKAVMPRSRPGQFPIPGPMQRLRLGPLPGETRI